MAEPMKKRGVLEFLSSASAGEKIKLRTDSTIVGREKGDIIIADKEISSSHCQIQLIETVYHIFDMNSTNGTFVNGQKIIKATLKDGDLITTGTSTFKFSMREDKELRSIPTVFKSKKDRPHQATSIVDTLIESELRSTSFNSLMLKVTYHDGRTEDIVLRQRVVFIGRASSFGQFDQDPEVSRKHLMIKLNDNGEVFIEDQGSTNGSRLNGKRISGMHLVRSNDQVKVGGSLIKITPLAS